MPIDMNSWTMRSLLAGAVLIVGWAIGWFGHQWHSAPPDKPTITIYSDWRLACPSSEQKDSSCEMQQDVLDSKTHSELARLSIFQLNGENTLLVTVPYNVLLEPGLALGFGNDKPIIYPYETCNAVGCVVRTKLNDSLRTSLGKTDPARVLFAGLDGKAVGLPFSTKGFNEASTAYDSAQARRHSWWRRLWS